MNFSNSGFTGQIDHGTIDQQGLGEKNHACNDVIME
jgi:hypothetical protein